MNIDEWAGPPATMSDLPGLARPATMSIYK